MGVPAVPLAELYDGCKAEIERRGGEVSLRMPVRAIHSQDGGVRSVEFDGGRQRIRGCLRFLLCLTKL